jgi:hypothetical protein
MLSHTTTYHLANGFDDQKQPVEQPTDPERSPEPVVPPEQQPNQPGEKPQHPDTPTSPPNTPNPEGPQPIKEPPVQ